MADVESGRSEERPGRAAWAQPMLRTCRRHGSVPTIAAAAVAVAAIAVCVVLFVQVGSLKKQLEASGVEVPAGIAAENGEAGAHGEAGSQAVDEYSWQDDPMEVIYELGEFQFNTADGKHGMMDIALVLESGWTTEDRLNYEQAKEYHDHQMEMYIEELREYTEKQMGALETPTGPVLAVSERRPRLLRSGVVLAMHGAAAPTGPPEEPGPPPDEPRTVLEKVLDERQPKVRDTVLGLVSTHTSAELITTDGRTTFKQELMDSMNTFIEDYFGRVIDVYFNEFVTT